MQIEPDWNIPSNIYGVSGLLRNLLPLIGVYAAAPFIADYSKIYVWALAPLIGLLIAGEIPNGAWLLSGFWLP